MIFTINKLACKLVFIIFTKSIPNADFLFALFILSVFINYDINKIYNGYSFKTFSVPDQFLQLLRLLKVVTRPRSEPLRNYSSHQIFLLLLHLSLYEPDVILASFISNKCRPFDIVNKTDYIGIFLTAMETVMSPLKTRHTIELVFR